VGLEGEPFFTPRYALFHDSFAPADDEREPLSMRAWRSRHGRFSYSESRQVFALLWQIQPLEPDPATLIDATQVVHAELFVGLPTGRHLVDAQGDEFLDPGSPSGGTPT
jgi:hypothetical protein